MSLEEEFRRILDKKYARFEKRLTKYITNHGMSFSFWKQWGARFIKPSFLGESLFVDEKFSKEVDTVYQAPIYYFLDRFCSENKLDCSIGYFDKEKTKSNQFFISSLEFTFVGTPRDKAKEEISDEIKEEEASSLDF